MFSLNFKNYNPRNIPLNLRKFFGSFDKRPVLTASVLFLIFYFFLIKPPADFPIGTIVKIKEGQNLYQISHTLKKYNVIKSEKLFNFVLRITGQERRLLYGDYYFDKKVNLLGVAHRLSSGDFNVDPVPVTIVEGETVYDIAKKLADTYEGFNEDKFILLAKEDEGYLFPDTYYFLPQVDEESALKAMLDNFNEKVLSVYNNETIGRSLDEVIIMASILEKEARTTQTRRIISGILWNRIDIGMPLQVDAVFPYINGKNTYQLTKKDLKIDSPYNTYIHKGLPSGPIANPSLDAIKAAMNPISSDYLFYLSDRSGNMYYSNDFEGHKINRILYLN